MVFVLQDFGIVLVALFMNVKMFSVCFQFVVTLRAKSHLSIRAVPKHASNPVRLVNVSASGGDFSSGQLQAARDA